MTDEKHLPVVAQCAGKPYGWAVERSGDNTFPRLYRTKAEADAMVEYVNVNPPATARPLYAARPQAAPVETPFLIYLDEGDGLLHLKVGGVEITTASPNTSRGVALLKLENSVCRSSAETGQQEG